MKLFVFVFGSRWLRAFAGCCAGLGLALPAFAQLPGPPVVPIAQQLADGQKLAADLRSAKPPENSEIRGILILKGRDKGELQVPVVCQVVLNDSTWKTIYRTGATVTQGAESLVVIHSTNGPNQYLYSRAARPADALPTLKALSMEQTSICLAGADFTLADLGLEFLHWPVQQQLKGEMRLGRPCYVLESRNAKGAEIVRIKSFIDKESGGLLLAEAFDRDNDMVKEFSLKGSSFKKVNGQWQLEKMTIRDKKKRSQTVLKFDLNRE